MKTLYYNITDYTRELNLFQRTLVWATLFVIAMGATAVFTANIVIILAQ